MSTFNQGARVRFKPGPRSTSTVDATVTGTDGPFLITRDDAGKERKIRPGSCSAA